MQTYGVNLIADAYYEIEAEDREKAIEYAFDLLYSESPRGIDWDCTEVVELGFPAST